MYPVTHSSPNLLSGIVRGSGVDAVIANDFVLCRGHQILYRLHNPTVDELRLELSQPHVGSTYDLLADFGDGGLARVIEVGFDVDHDFDGSDTAFVLCRADDLDFVLLH